MMVSDVGCLPAIDTLEFKPHLLLRAMWGAGIKTGPCDAEAHAAHRYGNGNTTGQT
jgi:hypothetical protein